MCNINMVVVTATVIANVEQCNENRALRLALVGWSTVGASVRRIVGEGARVINISFGDDDGAANRTGCVAGRAVVAFGDNDGAGSSTGCIVGRVGDVADVGEGVAGLVAEGGKENGGKMIGLPVGSSVVELVERSTMNGGAQDGCVLVVLKQRHVGNVRPLLSTLL